MPNKPLRLCTRARLLLRGLRYAPLLPFASIDGWLTIDEAITLFDLSRALPHEAPVAVEIGSWHGKSSVCLASGLHGKRQPRLWCIQPFDAAGDDERAQLAPGQPGQTFEANLRQAGLRELVEMRQGSSHLQAQQWQGPIDLLFLDGDPSYPVARQDFEDWAPKVRPGGYLVMHDVVHPQHSGPARVVDELVRSDPHWVDVRTVDSMFVARRSMA